MRLYLRNSPSDVECPHCGAHMEDCTPADERVDNGPNYVKCVSCEKPFTVDVYLTATYEVS